jgi:integrase
LTKASFIYDSNCNKSYHYTDLKTRAGRRELPIIGLTFQVLESISPLNTGPLPDLVFKTITGMPVDRGNLRRSFQRISKKADVPVITLHHLRHTAATNLKNIGIQARDTQLILGHAHITTTQQIYQHSNLEARYIALAQYEEKVVTVSAYCRQIKPSSDLNIQDKNENNFGSGERTRTSDLRLMSPAL